MFHLKKKMPFFLVKSSFLFPRLPVVALFVEGKLNKSQNNIYNQIPTHQAFGMKT